MAAIISSPATATATTMSVSRISCGVRELTESSRDQHNNDAPLLLVSPIIYNPEHDTDNDDDDDDDDEDTKHGGPKEIIRYQMIGTSLWLDDHPYNNGTLYITTRRVVWLSKENRKIGFELDYHTISTHSLYIKPISDDNKNDNLTTEVPEYIYCSLDDPTYSSARIVLPDVSQLQLVYDTMSQCADLNPDDDSVDDAKAQALFDRFEAMLTVSGGVADNDLYADVDDDQEFEGDWNSSHCNSSNTGNSNITNIGGFNLARGAHDLFASLAGSSVTATATGTGGGAIIYVAPNDDHDDNDTHHYYDGTDDINDDKTTLSRRGARGGRIRHKVASSSRRGHIGSGSGTTNGSGTIFGGKRARSTVASSASHDIDNNTINDHHHNSDNNTTTIVNTDNNDSTSISSISSLVTGADTPVSAVSVTSSSHAHKKSRRNKA